MWFMQLGVVERSAFRGEARGSHDYAGEIMLLKMIKVKCCLHISSSDLCGLSDIN